MAVLAQSVVAAVVAVPAVVADVVAVALSSTVEALDLLAAVEILVLLVAPSPQQFEIASLLPPPSPDHPLQLETGSAHPLQLQTRILFPPLQLEIHHKFLKPSLLQKLQETH